MRTIIIVSVVLAALFIGKDAQSQVKKIDTTASFGGAGFRVTCSNKKERDNTVDISPKGFKNTVSPISFPIQGRLNKIWVDDLNDDGFPDLLLCFYSGAHLEIVNVFGVASVGDASLSQVVLPDIYSDPKLREGYKGHDEFTIIMGSLMRSFPIYKASDTDTPTGGKRFIQYKIVNKASENNVSTFKVLRSYEKAQ